METRIHGFLLAPQQQRCWLHLKRTDAAKVAAMAVAVEGAYDPERLGRAFARTIRRHEILRTAFPRLGGLTFPAQVVGEREEARLARARDDGGTIAEILADQLRRPFDLDRGPIARGSLHRSAGRDFLVVAVSPLCADPATLGQLFREIVGAYSLNGADSGALDESFRYFQFSDWQRAVIESSSESEQAALHAAAGETVPVLPWRLRSVDPPAWPAPEEIELTAEETAAVARAAAALGASSADLLLAAWQALLWRTDERPKIVVGELCDFRDDALLAEAVGLFAKYLPVAVMPAADLPFRDLVAQVVTCRESTRELAAEFIWGGLERIERGELDPVPIGFAYRRGEPPVEVEGACFALEQAVAEFDRCDVALECRERGDRLALSVRFEGGDRVLSDRRRVVEQLRILILSAVARSDSPLAELEMSSIAERAPLNFCGEEISPLGLPVHALFDAQAAAAPETLAVVAEPRSLTYRELAGRANQLARGLNSAGIGPEAVVALCLKRSVDLVVGIFGVLKAGGAYVVIDPDQPRRRIGTILEDLAPAAVLTETSVRSQLPEVGCEMIRIDADWSSRFAALDDTAPAVPVSGENIAYLVLTSGSTGRPKGVAVEHRQLANYVMAIGRRLDFPAAASFATVSTFAADLGHTMIFPALVGGGTLHVLSPERAADPEAVAEYFSRHRIDCLKIVPSHLAALLELPEPRAALPRKLLVLGGEATPWELAERLEAAAPDCRIFNHYGPSETTVGVLTHRLSARDRDPRSATVPIGRPLANVEVVLLDARLRPVPTWIAGEVYIGGRSVARGYLGRPDLTAAAFVPHPWRTGDRLYRTGDLARRLPDGAIEFLGRRDHQVKLHGYRIELGEIRAALNELPNIRDSIVQMVRDEAGRDVVVAYCVSRLELDPAALREFLRGRLLEIAIPSWFVRLKRLPLNLNGKINYAALPALEEIKKETRRTFIAPRSATEEILAGLWSDLLGVKSVGVTDNFFELGGHSLLATQLVSRIRQAFQIELPLRALFETPTVGELAARIDAALRGDPTQQAPPILPRADSVLPLPLSLAQERLWIMHQLEPGSPAYNIPIALRVAGRLAPPELFASLGQVIRRHETLRTTFVEISGEPRQIVASEGRAVTCLGDLGGLPEARRGPEVERWSRAEAGWPFDLERGPLIRLILLRIADRENVVLLTMDHIVSDAWSMDVLVREMVATYGALMSRQAPSLPRPTLQYPDYALWQREWLRSPAFEGELEYWRRRLSGALEVLDLAPDRPRPQVRSLRGTTAFFELPAALVGPIRAMSRSQGATPFMTLLAAFYALLWRRTGREDLVVGTDIANRNRLELENLIGFFVNNLVLRVDLAGNPSFRQILRRVRETALAAFAHQELPFDRLVKALRPKRDLRNTPLFQVLFVYQNAPATAPRVEGLEISPLASESGTAKFDLGLFIREAGDRLFAEWNYSTDLFSRSTIEDLADSYARILERACSDPDLGLSELVPFTATETRQTTMAPELRETKLQRLKGLKRRGVDLDDFSLIATELPVAGSSLPLLLRPTAPDVDLVAWAASHRPQLEEKLERQGALLFRDFGIGSIDRFETLAASLSDDLFGEYGDLPSEERGQKVYRSTPYPADKTILFHNESSHMHRWPRKQFFYCVTAARSGGETPIVDCREIHRLLPAGLVAEFERRGLLYVRNFIDGLDVSWQEFFRTSDRGAVESYCRTHGIAFEWRGEVLQTRNRCAAVVRHPRTGEASFFNQVMLHHVYFLEPEVRRSMATLYAEPDFPRNVYFGDGGPIGDATMAEIEDLYRRRAVSLPWQEGDVLMVDNMLVAHARNPFEGPRKIVVAMGEMFDQAELG